MVYTIFEDKAENFYPFTINHSIIEIRGGAFSLLERVKQQISNEDKIILVVRDNIKDIVSERHPDIDVNPKIIPPSYLCRAGILDVRDSNSHVKLEKEISLSDFKEKTSNTSNEEYLWDYLKLNNLQNDRDKFDMSIKGDFHQSCVFVGKNNICDIQVFSSLCPQRLNCVHGSTITMEANYGSIRACSGSPSS